MCALQAVWYEAWGCLSCHAPQSARFAQVGVGPGMRPAASSYSFHCVVVRQGGVRGGFAVPSKAIRLLHCNTEAAAAALLDHNGCNRWIGTGY